MKSVLMIAAVLIMGAVAYSGDVPISGGKGTVYVPEHFEPQFTGESANMAGLVDVINKNFPVDTSDLEYDPEFFEPRFTGESANAVELVDAINKKHPVKPQYTGPMWPRRKEQ